MAENEVAGLAPEAVSKAPSIKEGYWLPSARALGAEALPLYHAELNRAIGAYDLGHLEEAEIILDALLNELEQTLPECDGKPTEASFHLLYAEVLTARGRTCERRNQDKQAKSFFRKAVAEFGEWIKREQDPPAQLYCHYGVALFKIGSTQRTIDALEAAKKKGPLNAEAYRYLAVCYCSKDVSKAEEYFAEALKQEPGDFLTRRAHAECLETQGKISDAITEYNHVALFLMTSAMFDEAQKVTAHMMELDPKDQRALVRAGETLLAGGLFEKALATMDQGLELQPKNAAAVRLKGLALFGLAKYDEAAKEFRRALKLDPTLFKARIKLASALDHLGDLKGALKVLDEALAERPDDPEALVEKASLLSSLNENAEALTVLEQALKVAPDSARALAIKGQVLTELGQNRRAAQALERSIKLDPSDARAHAALGQALSMLDRPEKALEALDKSLAIRPDYGPALSYKGETLRALGRNEEALQVLNQALTLRPTDAWALGTKGQVLHSLGMNEEAVEVLRKCVELDPSLAWAHGQLVAILYGADRIEETLEALDKALAMHPFANWYVFKGQVFNDIASFERALDAVAKAIKIDPGLAQAYGTRAWALENLRRPDALDAYQRAEKVDPKNLFWQVGTANSFYFTGDSNKASEKYQKVLSQVQSLAQNERNIDIIGLMGWCEFRLDHFETAVKLFNEALAINSELSPNVFNLALALLCNGQNEEALREYKRALRLVEAKPPLCRRGVIYVARDDLRLAVQMQTRLSGQPEVTEVEAALDEALVQLPEYQKKEA